MNRAVRLALISVPFPLALVLGIWFWTDTWPSFFAPSLSSVFASFRDVWLGGAFFTDVVPSLKRWGIAYLIATILGIGFGVPLGLSATLRQAFGPLIEFVRSIPTPALLPIGILALGIGDAMKIAVIVSVCLFPILLNTIAAMAEVQQGALDVVHSYRLPPSAQIVRVFIPSALPRIVAGMRTSCSLGLVVIVLSEMFGATNGIGYQILATMRSFDIPQMWSGVLLIGILGCTVNAIFELLQRRVLHWHHSSAR